MSKRRNEQIMYGLNACLAAAKERPEEIIRAYVTEKTLKHFKTTLQLLAKNKRAYHVVSEEELERLTSSLHHEGVSLLLKARAPASLRELLDNSPGSLLLVGLFGVSNPHNVGAIARSAAHFGANGLVLSNSGDGALSAGAYRVAQGGLEFLPIATASSRDLEKLKVEQIKLVAPSPHKGTPLSKFRFPKRTLLLFGEEGEGLSAHIEKIADSVVTIPGTGRVESLNVSSAAAVFLQAWWTQMHERKK